MRTWIGLVVFIAAVLPARGDDGFKPLFNGKDLSGWRIYFPPSAKGTDGIWSVKDGVIVCADDKKPNGYIITDKEFGNYVLKLQWRFPAGSPGGNSGVFLHVQPPDKVWPKGIEAQLMSLQAGDFWLVDGAKLEVDPARAEPRNPRHFLRIGERWETESRSVNAIRKNVEKPIGEWNQYEIHCDGKNIKLTINGQLVNEGKNCEFSKGKILLQAEGADIQFRNIEIKMK